MAHPFWPLYDLRIATGSMVLRLPDDDELGELIEVAKTGIHDPAVMPFANAWTDVPSPDFEMNFAQHHWQMRASWSKDNWHLGLVVFVDGSPVGAQGVGASAFALRRSVSSGSWLAKSSQGQGLGKLMRQAMLHFVFEGLGAEIAESEAWVDNQASIGVSRSVGYRDNGLGRHVTRGKAVDSIRFRITRDEWLATTGRPSVEISGLDACRHLFG